MGSTDAALWRRIARAGVVLALLASPTAERTWMGRAGAQEVEDGSDQDAAKAAYVRAARREQSGDLDGAYLEYGLVAADYPDSEWGDRAQARQADLARHRMGAELEGPAYSPSAAVLAVLYTIVRWAFWLFILSAVFGFWGYRRGWFWRSAALSRVADRVGGVFTRFRNRKRLARDLELRKANPLDAKARHSLGVMYYQGRRHEKALEELQESVSVDPDRTDAQYHLGMTLMKLNRMAEAVEPLESAAARRANHGGDAAVRLAEAKLAIGDPAAAEQLCRDFMGANPSDPDCRVMLAMALDAQGKPDEAPRLLEEAVRFGRAYTGVRKREALSAARRAKAYMRSRPS